MGCQIFFESILTPNRFTYPDHLHRTKIYPMREIVIQLAGLPKIPVKKFQRTIAELCSVMYPQCMHFMGSHFTNPPKYFDRQTSDKSSCFTGMDNKKTVRFAIIRSNLRQEFIIRDSGRSHQPQFLANLFFNSPGNVYG